MQITLPNELVQGLRLTPENTRLDLSIGLYAERRITLGRAAAIAALAQTAFLKKLGELHIPMHYDLPELKDDVLDVRETE